MTKTILITGGSRGIGAALVRRASQEFNVAFTYFKSEAAALALEKECGFGVKAYKCDVSDSAQVQKLKEEVLARFKKVDYLVNNAGISSSNLVTDISDEEWKNTLAVNVDGVFFVCRAFLPQMISRKSGSIVNVSSMWGQVGSCLETHYSASKGAVNAFTRALAKEVGPSNISVNAVAPGAIDTDMMAGYSEKEINALKEEIPLGRLGTPDEIAQAVLFLLENPYISGQILGVNGGIVV